VTYHLTFSINSLVHKFGTQPYSERNTSRDSRVIALLTMGEGYHNYHHTFPLDYRNGARWHEFDPTKWTVSCWESLGLAWNLKRTPFDVIARARLRTDQARLGRSSIPEAVKARISALSLRLNDMLAEWSALSRERKLATHPSPVALGDRALRQLDHRLRKARRCFEREYAHWQRLTRSLKPPPAC
jgi:stearoyl-CoA desaturase (delta-9 desaturase)